MKIEQQVCSLELAKRLKDLRVKQESLVYWLNIQHCVHMKVKEDGYTLQEDENGQPIVDKIDYRIELGNPYALNIDKDNCWSAFTSSELGEMLPIFSSGYNILRIERNARGAWIVSYECLRTFEKSFLETKLADAMAKMLIHLLEQGLIKNA